MLGILRLLGQRGDSAEAHVGHHGQRHSGHGAAELELGGVEQVGRREIRALGMLHDEHHAAHDEQRENRQLGYQRHLVHHHGGLHADKRHDGHNNEEPEAQSQNRRREMLNHDAEGEHREQHGHEPDEERERGHAAGVGEHAAVNGHGRDRHHGDEAPYHHVLHGKSRLEVVAGVLLGGHGRLRHFLPVVFRHGEASGRGVIGDALRRTGRGRGYGYGSLRRRARVCLSVCTH